MRRITPGWLRRRLIDAETRGGNATLRLRLTTQRERVYRRWVRGLAYGNRNLDRRNGEPTASVVVGRRHCG